MIRRYTERTKTYEFLVKFKVIVDPADNSSVASVLNSSQNPDVAQQIPTEVLEQKHKKKYLRKEASKFHGAFENNKPFWKPINERLLLPYLIELVTKAGNLLTCCGNQGRPAETMKILEMSLNKADLMLDKSKMLILKLEDIYVIVPFTVAKIEVRMRNMIINMRPKFEAISRFTKIYLDLYQEQAKKEKKAEQAWIEEQKRREIEEKEMRQGAQGKNKAMKQASVVPISQKAAAAEETRQKPAKQGGVEMSFSVPEQENSGSQVNLLKPPNASQNQPVQGASAAMD